MFVPMVVVAAVAVFAGFDAFAFGLLKHGAQAK